MRPGTVVRLPDGRMGTVVYHGLDGYGIQWGRVEVNAETILATDPLFGKKPEGEWPWHPEAMLRGAYPGAEIECVGDQYEVIG